MLYILANGRSTASLISSERDVFDSRMGRNFACKREPPRIVPAMRGPPDKTPRVLSEPDDADSANGSAIPVATLPRARAIKLVLGWKETIALATLGGIELPAKLDTGARTSALHAVDIVCSEKEGNAWVTFDLPDIDQSRRHRFCLPLAGHRSVKGSIGASQIRPLVRMELSLAGQTWTTEVTLTDRSDMELPMLIGRATLKGRFLVDPSRTQLASRRIEDVRVTRIRSAQAR